MTNNIKGSIITKTKRLENERKWKLKHSHLLDDNIEILSKPLDDLSTQDDINAFNTQNFSDGSRLRVFVAKPKSYLFSALKTLLKLVTPRLN